MRQFLVCVLLMLLGMSSTYGAEFAADKGSWKFAGAAYIQSKSGDLYEYNGEGSTEISFSVTAQSFISRSIAWGLTGSLYNFSQQGDVTEISAGPVLSVYLVTPEDGIERSVSALPYFEVLVLYTNVDYGWGYWVISFGGGLGVDLLVNDAVAITPHLRLLADSVHPDRGDQSESGLRFVFGLGFSYFLF